MARIVIVASVRLFREGLALGLTADSSLVVVGSAHDLADATQVLSGAEADVLLLDHAAPSTSGAIRSLVGMHPELAVVALIAVPCVDEVVACVLAGVSGILSRDASLSDLREAIHACRRGEFPCCPRMTRLLADGLRNLARPIGDRVRDVTNCAAVRAALGVTRRESEIVVLLREGLSNKEIARRLSIDVSTVKNHVHNILEKLGVERREQVLELQRN